MPEKPKSIEVLEPIDLTGKVERVTRVEAREMFKRARKVIDKLSTHYLEWADEDIDELAAELAGARADPADREAHIDRIFFIAHDMKGQGATFGYPLITEICKSLCYFLSNVDHNSRLALDVVAVHVAALRF
ncbi:MAG: Hpt domain-containing protein, partial [Geminicoccales bacterium]